MRMNVVVIYLSLLLKKYTEISLENVIKFLNDIKEYVELTPEIRILEDNNIKLPDMDDEFYSHVENLNIYNEDIKKLIEEYDYLFSAKKMGLL